MPSVTGHHRNFYTRQLMKLIERKNLSMVITFLVPSAVVP
jgi:hypothetical protein